LKREKERSAVCSIGVDHAEPEFRLKLLAADRGCNQEAHVEDKQE